MTPVLWHRSWRILCRTSANDGCSEVGSSRCQTGLPTSIGGDKPRCRTLASVRTSSLPAAPCSPGNMSTSIGGDKAGCRTLASVRTSSLPAAPCFHREIGQPRRLRTEVRLSAGAGTKHLPHMVGVESCGDGPAGRWPFCRPARTHSRGISLSNSTPNAPENRALTAENSAHGCSQAIKIDSCSYKSLF